MSSEPLIVYLIILFRPGEPLIVYFIILFRPGEPLKDIYFPFGCSVL